MMTSTPKPMTKFVPCDCDAHEEFVFHCETCGVSFGEGEGLTFSGELAEGDYETFYYCKPCWDKAEKEGREAEDAFYRNHPPVDESDPDYIPFLGRRASTLLWKCLKK